MEFEERKKLNEQKKSEQELAEFERKLHLAMRRHEAPLGLKSRVLAQSRARRTRTQHGRGWILQRLAASVLLAVLFGGVAVYHQVEQRRAEERQAQERRQGEMARDQVLLALRITSKTLDRVHEHLADDSR